MRNVISVGTLKALIASAKEQLSPQVLEKLHPREGGVPFPAAESGTSTQATLVYHFQLLFNLVYYLEQLVGRSAETLQLYDHLSQARVIKKIHQLVAFNSVVIAQSLPFPGLSLKILCVVGLKPSGYDTVTTVADLIHKIQTTVSAVQWNKHPLLRDAFEFLENTDVGFPDLLSNTSSVNIARNVGRMLATVSNSINPDTSHDLTRFRKDIRLVSEMLCRLGDVINFDSLTDLANAISDCAEVVSPLINVFGLDDYSRMKKARALNSWHNEQAKSPKKIKSRVTESARGHSHAINKDLVEKVNRLKEIVSNILKYLDKIEVTMGLRPGVLTAPIETKAAEFFTEFYVCLDVTGIENEFSNLFFLSGILSEHERRLDLFSHQNFCRKKRKQLLAKPIDAETDEETHAVLQEVEQLQLEITLCDQKTNQLHQQEAVSRQLSEYIKQRYDVLVVKFVVQKCTELKKVYLRMNNGVSLDPFYGEMEGRLEDALYHDFQNCKETILATLVSCEDELLDAQLNKKINAFYDPVVMQAATLAGHVENVRQKEKKEGTLTTSRSLKINTLMNRIQSAVDGCLSPEEAHRSAKFLSTFDENLLEEVRSSTQAMGMLFRRQTALDLAEMECANFARQMIQDCEEATAAARPTYCDGRSANLL